MRRITAEERALFLAALSGRLPPKKAPVKTSMRMITAKPVKSASDHLPRSSHPDVSDEDIELFLQAIGRRPRSHTASEPVILPLPVVKPRGPRRAGGGLDGGTKRKLDKGEIAPAAKLDLHGMTESAAHGALVSFLQAAHRRGERLILIVTGKGAQIGTEPPPKTRYGGVLRQMVPRWLEEAPMAQVIADKRWAHRRHGGEGALYVYLKKR